MGLGTPPQILEMIGRGVDMFDCVMPTRIARHGVAFTLATFSATEGGVHWPLVGFACACAFAGAVLGRRLLPSVTIAGLRRLTGALLLVVGFALASGLA